MTATANVDGREMVFDESKEEWVDARMVEIGEGATPAATEALTPAPADPGRRLVSVHKECCHCSALSKTPAHGVELRAALARARVFNESDDGFHYFAVEVERDG